MNRQHVYYIYIYMYSSISESRHLSSEGDTYKLIDMSWSYGVRFVSDEEAEVTVAVAVALVGDWRGVDVVGKW